MRIKSNEELVVRFQNEHKPKSATIGTVEMDSKRLLNDDDCGGFIIVFLLDGAT